MATTFAGVGAVDPPSLLADLAARNPPVPTDRWANKAGWYSTSPGARPGRGWVLLRLSDLATIDPAADHDLTFRGTTTAHVITLSPITLLARECVTPGSDSDPNSVYLCEVVDRRYRLAKVVLDKAYNLRTADGTDLLSATKNGSSPWTWQGVVQDLATALGIGTLTLPFTPAGAPENLIYWGNPNALACLCDVLDRLACALAYDPVANTFAAVRLGAAQDTHLDAITDPLTWDGYPTSTIRGKLPEKVRVRFPRRPVDATAGATPYYTVDVTLPAAAGAPAGTYIQVEDGLSALGSTGTPTNAAALATVAAERAADWLRKQLYYDRPVLRAWRDFVPDAASLGGYAVRRVAFDDRGLMQTWAESGDGDELEDWKPLGGWPVWLAAPAGDPGPCVGCSSLAGWRNSSCLIATLVSVSGACDCPDLPDPVTDCAACPELPGVWTSNMSGFTVCAVAGTYTWTHTTGCNWTAADGSTLVISGRTATVTLPGGATYAGSVAGKCCGPLTLTRTATGTCGTSPATITLAAAGPCATPDTWDCVDGVCVKRTDGSGAYASEAACVAAPCGSPPNPGSQACCPGSPKMTTGTIDVAATSGDCGAYDTGGPHPVFYFETASEAVYSAQNTQGDVFLVVCHSDGTWSVTMADHAYGTRVGVVASVECAGGHINITATFLMVSPPCNGTLTLGATFTP